MCARTWQDGVCYAFIARQKLFPEATFPVIIKRAHGQVSISDFLTLFSSRTTGFFLELAPRRPAARRGAVLAVAVHGAGVRMAARGGAPQPPRAGAGARRGPPLGGAARVDLLLGLVRCKLAGHSSAIMCVGLRLLA